MAFDAGGLRLAGLAWGPKDGRPVIALHGWLDNAGSFSVLAPLLEGARVVALDAPGHGLSDPHGADANYNIWEDLPQLEGVLDALGWDQATLLGHSRGGIQSTIAAAAMPERIAGLITLDGLIGRPLEPDATARQLGAFLRDRRRHLARGPRHFASQDDFVARRVAYGVTEPVARRIGVRALEDAGAAGFRLRGDARLQGASAVKFSEDQYRAILGAVACPALVIWAEGGMRDMVKIAAPESLLKDARVARCPGDHHFHLDPACAPAIAAEINVFLA